MKVPEKIVPLLFVLLLVAAYLLGRSQAQVELLKGDGQTVSSQAGSQVPSGQTAQQGGTGGGTRTVVPDELWNEILARPAGVKGEENAPVTMVEFTDYQCPFCSRHFTSTQPQIESEYIEAGKVRYMVRDLPLPIHPNAPAAAMAARCAGDQGQYWQMHDMLFENQEEWSSGNTSELFPQYSSSLGLNSSTFSSCLSEEKYKQEIDEDIALAQRVGASGTPAFLVNGELIIGAQPFTAFQEAIERGL